MSPTEMAMDAAAIEIPKADALFKHLDFLRTSAQEDVQKALEGMDLEDRRLFASAAAILALGGAASFTRTEQSVVQAPQGEYEQRISDSVDYAGSGDRLNIEGKIDVTEHNKHGVSGTLVMKPLDAKTGKLFSVDISDVQVPDKAIDDLLDPSKPLSLFQGYTVDEKTREKLSAQWRDLARDVAATRAAYDAVIAEVGSTGAHARSIISVQADLMAMVDEQLGGKGPDEGAEEVVEQGNQEEELNAIEDAVSKAQKKAEEAAVKPERKPESEPEQESDEDAIAAARESLRSAAEQRESSELKTDSKIEIGKNFRFNEDGLRGSADIWEDPETGELIVHIVHVSVTDPKRGHRFVAEDAREKFLEHYDGDQAMTELALELIRKESGMRAAEELLLSNVNRADAQHQERLRRVLEQEIVTTNSSARKRFGDAYVSE